MSKQEKGRALLRAMKIARTEILNGPREGRIMRAYDGAFLMVLAGSRRERENYRQYAHALATAWGL